MKRKLCQNWSSEVSWNSIKKSLPACWLRCPHLSNIQLCMLLFGTVMYGYHMDQNPEDGIYSLNFEAGHRTFVKQWEMSQFTIGKSVNFWKYFFLQQISLNEFIFHHIMHDITLYWVFWEKSIKKKRFKKI